MSSLFPALSRSSSSTLSFFFFNDTATTEIYTLSLHDALPIYLHDVAPRKPRSKQKVPRITCLISLADRKSTRLNSSHLVISYAVFCLKKKRRCLQLLSHGSPLYCGRPLPAFRQSYAL